MVRVRLRCKLCNQWVDIGENNWEYSDENEIVHIKCEEVE